MRKYRVQFIISGDVFVSSSISFNTDKELSLGNVFTSDITIEPDRHGFKITSTVQTEDRDRAMKVAILFIGKMLDILAMKIDSPLIITQNSVFPNSPSNIVRAEIDKGEFEQCFEWSRTLNLYEPALSRAFNWYRKGLYSDEPFDKFLAFWNSISVTASKYHSPDERTKLGIKNQIWKSFIALWGQQKNWPLMADDIEWINDNNKIRDQIAHGLIPIEVDYVENVITRLDVLQQVTAKFLKTWAYNKGYDWEGVIS